MLNMDKRSQNRGAVSQRILETRKETEGLKQQLQDLIAAGVSGSQPVPSTSGPLKSSNKVQIIKSYDPKHSQRVTKPVEGSATALDPATTKNEAQSLSPKKPKTYDVDQAREYIRKQRDTRRNELITKKSSSKVTEDMRKERLVELKQRARELVKKNVEAKRQRSKSRDRRGVSPANESLIMGFNCAGISKVHSEEPIVNQISSHGHAERATINEIRPPEPVKDPSLLNQPPTFTLGNNSSRAAKCTKSSYSLNVPSIADNKHSRSLQNLLRPPETHYGSRKESNKSSENVLQRNTSKKQQTTVKPHQVDQTKKVVTPEWLKDNMGQGDPYNFINTVKRQLNYVVAEKKSSFVDVGVQGDLGENYSEPNNTRDASRKMDLRSFISHKCLNSDPHIDLKRKKHPYEFKDGPTLTNSMGSDYDSDTSKNIPSISSESGTSLRRNAEFVQAFSRGGFRHLAPPNLDTKKVDDVKLRKPSAFETRSDKTDTLKVPQQEDVERIKKQLFNDSDHYSSDFIPTDLHKSRESVISFNCAKVSPNRVPVSISKYLDSPPISKNDGQTTGTLNVAISEITSSEVASKSDGFTEAPELKDADLLSSDFIATDLRKSRESVISFNCAKVSPNRVPVSNKSISEYLDSPLVSKKHSETTDELNIGVLKISSSEVASKSDGSTEVPELNYSSDFIPTDLRESRKAVISSNSANLSPNIIRIPENSVQHSQRKSGSYISGDGSHKRNTQYYSLCSELRPSTASDSDGLTDHNVPPSSECRPPETNSSKYDGFTQVLKPKQIFTDSNNSLEALSNSASENTGTVSNLRRPGKFASNFYKSKSEQVVAGKENAAVFSKSDWDIREIKKNLKAPKLSLNITERKRKGVDESSGETLRKNVSIRSGDRTSGDKNNTNEIHLRFEAEIHLLNDFNQSLKTISEIEKAFESLRLKNDSETITKKVQSRDTQTSIVTKSSSRTVSKQSDQSGSHISTINYSRGSDRDSEICTDRADNSELTNGSDINQKSSRSKRSQAESDNLLVLTQVSDLNNGLTSINFEDLALGDISQSSIIHISQLDNVTVASRSLSDENQAVRNVAGMSLRMLDQLIKDEDARIENWKKIIRVREQALLDRTRGELVYLEMQRKQLIETSKMAEASLIKKKQRGILLRHQQEKHEMQRLKQMQKEASAKRKTLLKGEKNLIKNQLLSDNMLSKLKPATHRERRLSGPLRVIQASGSLHSETSMSKRFAGTDQEIKNLSTSCSVALSAASDNFISDVEPLERAFSRSRLVSTEAISNMKKRLLMREHALAKRRKTVEELLQWHKKLLEEEKAIENLESKAEQIISKIPNESNEEQSKQPQDLSLSISDKVSSELNTSSMSQVVLNRLLPLNQNVSVKTNEDAKNIPQEEQLSEDSNKVVSSTHYSPDFDVESVPEVPEHSDDQSNVSSISQLIENFSQIEDNILSLVQKRRSVGSEEAEVSSAAGAEEIVPDEERSEASSHSNQIASEVEVKRREEESPSEVVQHDDSLKDCDGSVPITKYSSDESNVGNEENQLVLEDSFNKDCDGSVIIIKDSSDDSNAGSEENQLVKEPKEDSFRKDSEEIAEVSEINSESKNAPRTFEELSVKEHLSEVVSVVSEKLNVADEPRKSSIEEDVVNKVTEDPSLSTLSEDALKSTCSIHVENEPSSSQPKTTEDSRLLSTTAKPLASHTSSDNATSAQVLSGEPTLSVSQNDVSTSQQFEDIHEYAASTADMPSTSHQTEEASQVVSLTRGDVSIDEQAPPSHSSIPTPSIIENDLQSSSVVEEERESFENKTDEEKVASLSIRGSSGGSPRALAFHEPSVSEARSLTSGYSENIEVSEASGTLTVEDSRLTGASVNEENSHDSDDEDSRISDYDSVSAPKTLRVNDTVVCEQPSTSTAPNADRSSSTSEHSPRSLDVKKRVQEILSEARPASRGERMQDLFVMAYDVISPTQSPEAASPLEEKNKSFNLGSEAEELLRKQLAIEQEIKLLTEQQQKEQQAPQFYIREIPNKPPPPYTPPSKAKTPKTPSIIPSSKEEIQQITEYSAKIIHKAYLSNNLDNISISGNTLNLIAKNIDKGCYKYVFDLCKEVAIEHYSQFAEEAGPSWLQMENKNVLAPSKPLDVTGLKRLMDKKLLELFGLEKQEKKENAIMKWSRKKRDHVDEVLVQEMQAEENSWTNFDRDELIVKERITNEIMQMLLKETAQVLKKTVQKKNYSQ